MKSSEVFMRLIQIWSLSLGGFEQYLLEELKFNSENEKDVEHQILLLMGGEIWQR
jgi:hypothetical protein